MPRNFAPDSVSPSGLRPRPLRLHGRQVCAPCQGIFFAGARPARRCGPRRKGRLVHTKGAQCGVLLAADHSGRPVGVGAAFDLLQVLGTQCGETRSLRVTVSLEVTTIDYKLCLRALLAAFTYDLTVSHQQDTESPTGMCQLLNCSVVERTCYRNKIKHANEEGAEPRAHFVPTLCDTANIDVVI